MGFLDERIRTKHHREYGHDYVSHYHPGHKHSYYQEHLGSSILMRLAANIIKNKTLLIAVVIACVVVVILGIVILIKLVPWVFSLFGYLEQGGVNGFVDTALRIFKGVWEGAGKV